MEKNGGNRYTGKDNSEAFANFCLHTTVTVGLTEKLTDNYVSKVSINIE
jgi:hypothetical protein